MNNNLMTSRRFGPLFWTQFFSAFNDNFLKNTLVFLILFQLATDSNAAASLVTLAGAIFMAPFLILSALGGQLADKLDKGRMAEKLKLAEIGAAVVSVIGMYFSSIPVMMTALFGFGVISALFGPIKYGILPDHLETHELPKANAWVEGATFIAILGGTIVAGLAAVGDGGIGWFGPMMIAFAVACWMFSRYIPDTGSKAPDLQVDKNIFRSTWQIVKELKQTNRIWIAGLMVAWFWGAGAIVMSLMPTMVKDILGGNELAVTAYLAIFAISVAIGSAIAAWMSAGRVVLLPAPVGTFFMAIFGLDLAYSLTGLGPVTQAQTLGEFFDNPSTIRVGIDLAGMALFGALLAVPTFTAVQAWAEEDQRARVIAGANVLSAGAMTFGGLGVAVLQSQGVSIPVLILGLSILNLTAAWFMLRYLPTNPLRDFVSILFRAFHRLEVKGLENVKKAGDAPIIALNHVSLLDGPLAMALTEEEPVFAVDYNIANKWWAKPFLALCDFLPLDPANPMATRTLIKSVRSGKPMVIFPEGRLTVTGSLMKVYDGAAMVADKTDSMVVPVKIDGLERSRFSYLNKDQVNLAWFPKVTVQIMEPVKLDVPENLTGKKRRQAAGANLYQVMSHLVFNTTSTDTTILERVIGAAREQGMKKLAVEDALTGKLSYGKLLTGAAVLGEKFKQMFPHETNIGVLLPNANGTAATILGVMAAGKVPAMLNFTAGTANVLSACKTAEVKTVLTSHAFVEQGKLQPLMDELEKHVRVVWMDELRETITLKDKLLGTLRKEMIRNKRKADDPAVILFTSGSEGTPKGVVLTHRNILSNAAQAAARIDFNAQDKVFNVLPVFHSFGLTAGTILPLISGVPVYFYPSPLHYRVVPELIYVSNSTIIFGTDTFLNGYARTAHAYDFRSIRYCFAGAEPVKASTRETYMDKFGIRILEGYGVTETAPVISINTPMYNKAGTVGKIMPGMEYRLEYVPGVEEGGRLHVKGPNVMAGYLLADDPGVLKPLEDGWHDTGDIVTIDEEGFVKIRGRAKRFAKIGGEMVSLAAVEALAAELWPGVNTAVASVPDPKKGEKLIMITEAEGVNRKDFMTFAKSKGAMDLMVPAEVHLDKVPMLGSGKVDFVGVKKRVEELLASSKPKKTGRAKVMEAA
ncbi:MAG: acyl-[ACP]--phospholipid O-acyltransferase [Pseudomonadota bacterium]